MGVKSYTKNLLDCKGTVLVKIEGPVDSKKESKGSSLETLCG